MQVAEPRDSSQAVCHLEGIRLWPEGAIAWVEATRLDGDGARIATTFDPLPFLARASERELVALADAGWRGQHVMLAVQSLVLAGDAELTRWFGELSDWLEELELDAEFSVDALLDPAAALSWLRVHRPRVVEHLPQLSLSRHAH